MLAALCLVGACLLTHLLCKAAEAAARAVLSLLSD